MTSDITFTELGVPQSICDQLQNKKGPFRFNTALPVQAEVIPFALKAFSSWLLHCDIGLASPTGSGKTLCYCLPMIHAILEQRKRFAPTSSASSSQQQQEDAAEKADNSKTKKSSSVYVGIDRHLRGVIVVPTAILAEQVTDVLAGLSLNVISGVGGKQAHSSSSNAAAASSTTATSSIVKTSAAAPTSSPLSSLNVGTLFRANDDGSNLFVTKSFSASGMKKSFGTIDILVATPQKLCSWIERLADEDEDDDDDDDNKKTKTNKIVDIFGRTQLVVLDEADDLLSTGFFTSMAGRIVDAIQFAVNQQNETVLHKMLCSATLTARISKVSDVKLQNAKYFALDSLGNEIVDADGITTAGGGASGKQQAVVRQKFPLPASLHEHLVIVRDDAKRHVTLLNVVRYALDILRKAKEEQENPKGGISTKEDQAVAEAEIQQQQQQSTSSWKTTGSSIIVFCQTAEVARVMGHFLSLAGIDALELTTLTSDAERRQAALAVAAAKSSEQKVIVASDALMRGIDLPGVGAVIQYDPPQTLQQFVHRVGRTSRAGAVGHSFVLLSKLGFDSGKEEDGQVAHFKSFDAMLLRKGKVENLVKLRELVDEEVEKADEILMKTKLKLNGTTATATAGGAAATSKNSTSKRTTTSANSTKNESKKHDDSKRRTRA